VGSVKISGDAGVAHAAGSGACAAAALRSASKAPAHAVARIALCRRVAEMKG